MNICVHIYGYMHMCQYISDFGVDIFCTNNMHFSKCVYTVLSLNLYTPTLSSCNSRDHGFHFMDGNVRGCNFVACSRARSEF